MPLHNMVSCVSAKSSHIIKYSIVIWNSTKFELNMKKITIFTPYSLNPLHPRLEKVHEALITLGYNVEIINVSKNKLRQLLSICLLGFFDLYNILKFIVYLKDSEIIYIQDMSILPLSFFAKFFKKKVVYETLDNCPHLYFYGLSQSKKLFWLAKFNCLLKFVTSIEKFIVKNFVDSVIVNSKALADYFGPTAKTIYYCSPLESKKGIKNNPHNKIGGLYLGIFSKEKGCLDIIGLIEKMKIKLFIFGNINDKAIAKSVSNNRNIFWRPRMSSKELSVALNYLLLQYFLIGFSLIQPVHYSYETQEANKDIDYLAMGIPIIGNSRKTTKEKIIAGCGIHKNDKSSMDRLCCDQKFRATISNNCIQYYKDRYSESIFKKKVTEIIERL